MVDEFKPRVAHFIRGFLHPTETFILNQINSISDYEVITFAHHIIKNGLSGSDVNPVFITDILNGYSFRLQKYAYKFFRIFPKASAFNILNVIKEKNIQVIHFHYLVDARFFLNIIKYTRVPVIVSGYGWDVSNFPHKIFGLGRIYLKSIFNRVSIFIAMSEDMKRDMIKIGCPEEKIIVHYHGINTIRFNYPERNYKEKDTLNILFCGSLNEKKRPDRILTAMKRIEEEKLSDKLFRIIIVGEGPLRNKLEALIIKYNWEDKVVLKGHIPHYSQDFVNEYLKADLFVFPCKTYLNYKEGIPGTLVEAMASGLPIISSRHAGIPEIISSGADGLLCNEESDDELVENTVLLFNDLKFRERLGKAAQIKSKNLDINIKTKELEKIYSSVLS